MAKRFQLNFHHVGPTRVAEDGQPRPCAMGVGWVNQTSQETIATREIARTDPYGNPMPEAAESDEAETPASD